VRSSRLLCLVCCAYVPMPSRARCHQGLRRMTAFDKCSYLRCNRLISPHLDPKPTTEPCPNPVQTPALAPARWAPTRRTATSPTPSPGSRARTGSSRTSATSAACCAPSDVSAPERHLSHCAPSIWCCNLACRQVRAALSCTAHRDSLLTITLMGDGQMGRCGRQMQLLLHLRWA